VPAERNRKGWFVLRGRWGHDAIGALLVADTEARLA